MGMFGLIRSDVRVKAEWVYGSVSGKSVLKALCTDDFVWANSGLPTLRGLSEIFEHMGAGGFAQHRGVAGDIQDVVHDLKGQAQGRSAALQCRHLRR